MKLRAGPLELAWGKKQYDPAVPGPSPAWVSFMGIPFEGDALIAGVDTYERSLQRAIWIWRCVDIIANFATQAPLELRAGTPKNYDVVEEHPILDLLDDVNPYGDMDGTDLKRALIIDMLLRGETFVEPVRNRAGLPAELYWHSPDEIEPIKDAKTFIRGFRYMRDPIDNVRFELKDMYWWKRHNPEDRWSGLSAISAMKNSINLDFSAQRVQRSVYSNGGLARGIISPKTEEPLPPGETKKVAAEFKEEQGGSANAHSVGFLSYPIEFVKLGISSDEAQWMETRKTSRIEICGGFGVPLILAGDDERSTYDNYKSARRSMWEDTEIGWLDWYAEHWNNTLVKDFDPDGRQRLFLAHNYTKVAALQYDPIEQGKLDLDEQKAGTRTINEIRARRGDPPVPWGDSFWGPITTVEIANTEAGVIDRPAPAPRTPPTIGAPSNAPPKPLPAGEAPASEPAKSGKPVGPWETFDECVAAQVARGHTTEEARRICGAIENQGRFSRTAKLRRGSKQFDPSDPAIETLVGRLGERIVRIDEQTRSAVDDVIKEGMRRGYSPKQIADGVDDEAYGGLDGLFTETWASREDTIARTETSDAYSQIDLVAFDEFGIEQKEWMLGIGDDQGLCQELDGEVVGVDELFSDGSDAPPDPHPNCTCSLLPVIAGKRVEATARKAMQKRVGDAIALIETRLARDVRAAFDDQHAAIRKRVLAGKTRKIVTDDVYVSAVPALERGARRAFYAAGEEAWSAVESIVGS